MKVILLILVLLFATYTSDLYGQEKAEPLITIDAHDMPLLDFMWLLSREYHIHWLAVHHDEFRPVTVHAEQEPLTHVLDRVFNEQPSGVRYRVLPGFLVRIYVKPP